MGTVPIHESVLKHVSPDLLGVENGFAVSKTGYIALLAPPAGFQESSLPPVLISGGRSAGGMLPAAAVLA